MSTCYMVSTQQFVVIISTYFMFFQIENEDQRMEIPERRSLVMYNSVCYSKWSRWLSPSVCPLPLSVIRKSACHEYLRGIWVKLAEDY